MLRYVLLAMAMLLPGLSGAAAEQDLHPSLPGLLLPVTGAEMPKTCCRTCRKGKACGDGCIKAEKHCTREPGCACNASEQ